MFVFYENSPKRILGKQPDMAVIATKLLGTERICSLLAWQIIRGVTCVPQNLLGSCSDGISDIWAQMQFFALSSDHRLSQATAGCFEEDEPTSSVAPKLVSGK